MNRALPIEKLKGAVFGEPISQDYHMVISHIGNERLKRLAMLSHVKVFNVIFG